MAIDGGGDTVPVPSGVPVSEDDKRFEQYAIRLAVMRKEQEDDLPL